MNTITKLALIAILPVAAACGKAEGAPAPADAATPIKLADVTPAGSAAAITATGTLGAKDEVPLSFKIGGIVAKVLVDEGATVRRGQVLAVLDQREIDAMVAKATAGAEKARRDAARAERLFKDSVATLAQLQDAQTARDAAEADLRTARVNHEFATIVAPSDGVVLTKLQSAGQMTGPGAPVFMFASKARGNVIRAGVPDRDAVAMKVGMPATVTFEAVPGKTFTGRVSQVGASADPRTGTYAVEISLSGVDALPSGLVGRIVVGGELLNTKGTKGTKVSEGTSGLSSIPAESLVEGDGTRGVVYTVDKSGKLARKLNVTLVSLSGDRVLVRGLDGVSKVVSAGATWLTDSAKVEIKP